MSTIYQINKGVGKPIEFKGLYGQYISYLAVGLVVLLMIFAGGYILGLPLIILLPFVIGLGVGLFLITANLSKRFGVHGLGKYFAKKGLPVYIRFSSRRVFTGLKNHNGKGAAR